MRAIAVLLGFPLFVGISAGLGLGTQIHHLSFSSQETILRGKMSDSDAPLLQITIGENAITDVTLSNLR